MIVEVFRAATPCPASWAALLSAEESARVDRLRRPEDRARAMAGRALLRIVVADRLDCHPVDIAFVQRCAVCGGDHGKPVAVAPSGPVPVHASVSLAGALALVAVAEVSIGLDVERCAATAFAGFDELALSAIEQREMAATRASARSGVRAALWTAKEAILKINGRGLSVPPASVHVGRRGEPGTVRVDPTIATGGVVAVAAVSVEDDYRARVACEGVAIPDVIQREIPSWSEARGGAGRTAMV